MSKKTLTWIVVLTGVIAILLLLAVCAITFLGIGVLVGAEKFSPQPTTAVEAVGPTIQPTTSTLIPTPTPTPLPPPPTPAPMDVPAGPSIKPTESFCQLGVTQLTDGVPIHALTWDPQQLRGYMDDELSTAIWENTAYCRTEFPTEVTLIYDSVAANPVQVDGKRVPAGNGQVATGRVFEWIYTHPSRSNGHAFIVQP